MREKISFIHIADIHLGAEPYAGKAWSSKRRQEIWDTFQRVLEVCEEKKIDLLLIAGDLFHRQPLLRELKEINYLFSKLSCTQVVLIAGNHDYIKKESYYRSFSWEENVHFLGKETLERAVFKSLGVAVYGWSYHEREIKEARYQNQKAPGEWPYEILLAHGGDEKHCPINFNNMANLGYTYVALGHIHQPAVMEANRIIYSGSLEPTDILDIGNRGFVIGTISGGKVKTTFVPFALRIYIEVSLQIDRHTTKGEIKDRLAAVIEEKGKQNMYRLTLEGEKDPEIRFTLEELDCYGNLIALEDRSHPAYSFEELERQHHDNLLGAFIRSFGQIEEDSIQYEALCQGVHALLATKRE